MASNEVLTARLEEAETALHDLLTGQKRVEVSYDGRRVAYTQTNIADLRSYISELKVKLGQKKRRSRSILARF